MSSSIHIWLYRTLPEKYAGVCQCLRADSKTPAMLRKKSGAGAVQKGHTGRREMLSKKHNCKYSKKKYLLCVVKGQPVRARALSGWDWGSIKRGSKEEGLNSWAEQRIFCPIGRKMVAKWSQNERKMGAKKKSDHPQNADGRLLVSGHDERIWTFAPTAKTILAGLFGRKLVEGFKNFRGIHQCGPGVQVNGHSQGFQQLIAACACFYGGISVH